MAQHTKPFVGINADLVPASKQGGAHARVNVGYFDSVVTAGGLPVILPPRGKDADPDAVLDRIDGLVLSGGLDMDPKRLGLPSHPTVQPMAARREESDTTLIRRAIERRIPILARDLGGGGGRNLLFDVASGIVSIRTPGGAERVI